MKKLLFILLVFIMLVSCEPIFEKHIKFDEEYCIIKIKGIKNEFRKKVYLKDADGVNYYFYTFEESYKVGDKFKLIKIKENKE
jgi:hypothetical protein